MKTKRSIMSTIGLVSLPFIVATASAVAAIELHNDSTGELSLSAKTNDAKVATNAQSIKSNLKPIINYVQEQPINLNVNVPSYTNLKYQWFLNNKPIRNLSGVSGENTSHLIINSPSLSLNGDTIYCQITYSDGSVQNTNTSTLNLLANFKISKTFVLSDVKNNSIEENKSFTLQAKTDINPNYNQYLTYQWYFNNKPIQNATSESYTINSSQFENEGEYYCQINLNWNNKIVQTINTNVQKITVVPKNIYKLGIGFKSDSAKYLPNSSNPYIFMSKGDHFTLFALPVEDKSLFSTSSDNITFQWYKDGNALTDSNQHILDPNDNVLEAQNIDYQDSGMYYCVARYILKDGQTLTTQTIPIYLSVKDPNHLDICENVLSQIVDEGDSTSFRVQATYNGEFKNISYQWYMQADSNSAWQMMPNQTKNTLNLSPDQVTNYNGYKFVCAIQYKNPTNNQILKAYSNIASLNVNPVHIEVLSQPLDATKVLIGQNVSFSVNAITSDPLWVNKLKYQWVQITDGKNVKILQGETSPILNLNNVQGNLNNTSYVCHIYFGLPGLSKEGVFTKQVKLLVNQPKLNPNVTIQGLHSIYLGQDDNLSIQATSTYDKLPNNYNYHYQWMISNNNKQFSNIENANQPTLNLDNIKEENTYYYKCLIQVMNGNEVVDSQITPSFILNVQSQIDLAIKIPNELSQPLDSNLHINPEITVNGDVTNLMKEAKYQWQIANIDSTTHKIVWSNIVNQTNKEFNLAKLDNSYNNKQIRLQVDVANKEFDSNPLSVHVLPTLKTVQISNIKLSANIATDQTISVQLIDTTGKNIANINGYKFQWFVKENNKWEIIQKAINQVLHLNNIQKNWDNSQFYCVVTMPNNKTMNSPVVTLNINPINIHYHENGQIINLNQTQNWNLKLDQVHTNYQIPGAKIFYQWQTLDSISNKWINLNEHSIDLDLHDLKKLMNNEEFRCVISYRDDKQVYASVITTPFTIIKSTSDATTKPNPSTPPNHSTIPNIPSQPNQPNTPTPPSGPFPPSTPSNPTGPTTPGEPSTPSSPTKSLSNLGDGWIAFPIVFGLLIGIVGGIGLIYWFIKSKKHF